MQKRIGSSELPISGGDRIYHLDLCSSQLADKVILVGDPNRVQTVTKYFSKIELDVAHRELRTQTGEFNGQRISVVGTGMGTDNIDIVLTELDALANIDLKTGIRKEKPKSLEIIRIGTSGSFVKEFEVNSFCASKYALGLDGLLNYYQDNKALRETKMEEAFIRHSNYPSQFARPYIMRASKELFEKIAFDMQSGITVTASGFFGPQGREVRLPLSFPSQNQALETFEYEGNRISNMEMETSAIYGLGQNLGHKTLTLCVLIANRHTKDFSKDYSKSMDMLIETVLSRLTK